MLPSLRSFSDEICKLAARRDRQRQKTASAALTGGLIGGGLGAMLPGNKIRNGIIGGAVGGLAGKTVGLAKQHFIDPDHHRGAQLAAMPPPGDPNYVPTWQQGYR